MTSYECVGKDACRCPLFFSSANPHAVIRFFSSAFFIRFFSEHMFPTPKKILFGSKSQLFKKIIHFFKLIALKINEPNAAARASLPPPSSLSGFLEAKF